MNYEFDIQNISLIDDDVKSNAEGGYQPSKEEIEASAKLTQALIANRQAKKLLEAQTGCKKPFFNMGKKKDEYEKCLSDSQKKKDEARLAEAEQVRAQLELEKLKQQNIRSSSGVDTEKKFLGMSQTAGIIVSILGVTALAVGGYFIWKKVSA